MTSLHKKIDPGASLRMFPADHTAHAAELLAVPPGWLAGHRGQTLEERAFFSGAALCQLQLALTGEIVPQAVWRDRLALQAAEACMVLDGRAERVSDLRDTLHLCRAGDLPGPAGEVALAWQKATARPLSRKPLQAALAQIARPEIVDCLDAGRAGPPLTRAATVLEMALTADPRSPAAALILADAALARALGWRHLLPLLALGLGAGELHRDGEALRLACHRAVSTAALIALRLAADLTRRAGVLQAVAPKLRARGAAAAVEQFLRRDAVAPRGADQSAFGSGRATVL